MKHKLALIGCGGMARAHVSRLEPLFDRLEVAATVDIDRPRAEAVSVLLPNHPPAFTDYHDALPLCDCVLQVLPHHLHPKCTIECLDAGKHVLAEKPLANSEKECLDMIAAAKRNHRVLMVAYCMRFHPLLMEMKRLLDEKVYGRCFQLSIWTEQYTRGCSMGIPVSDEDFWAGKKALVGGGQLFSHGCHYIDLMLWMLGNPVSGTHMGSNYCTEWMEREGTSNVTIQFENGAMGYHFGTWGAKGTRHGYSFHAHCEEGMLEADIRAGRLYLHSKMSNHNPGEHETENIKVLMEAPSVKPTTAEMAHFLDCVDTGRNPFTNPEESLNGLRVIWRLYEAEEQNRLADLRGLGISTSLL